MRGWMTMVLAGCVVWTTLASADEILLRNGNVIRGDILVEGQTNVKIKVFFGDDQDAESSVVMEIPKERIRRITKEGSLFKERSRTEIKTKEETEMLERREATSAESQPQETETKKPETSTETEKPEEPAIDPALKREVELMMQNLANTALDNDVREQTKQRIIAMGKEVVPLLGQKLISPQNALQKIALIEILGEIKDKRVTLLLIDQMKGGGENTYVMRAAWVALKKITGQVFFFDEHHGANFRNTYIENWTNWFETVEEEYPVQIGHEGRKEALERAKAEKEKAEAADKKAAP